MLVLCNKCYHQRKKYQDLSSSLIPLLYPTVAGVTKLPYTRSSAPTGYAYTIGILERLILHLHGYLITGSSGTAVGGKGLRSKRTENSSIFRGIRVIFRTLISGKGYIILRWIFGAFHSQVDLSTGKIVEMP